MKVGVFKVPIDGIDTKVFPFSLVQIVALVLIESARRRFPTIVGEYHAKTWRKMGLFLMIFPPVPICAMFAASLASI